MLGGSMLTAQDNLWVNGSQLLDFNAPAGGATVCGLPLGHDYNGAPAQYAQNAQYDEHGKLLFFVVDGNIYDHEGYRMADNDQNANCTDCLMRGISEISIVLVPGTCDRYYIIAGKAAKPGDPSCAWTLGQDQSFLTYSMLDLGKESIYHGAEGRKGRMWTWDDAANDPALWNAADPYRYSGTCAQTGNAMVVKIISGNHGVAAPNSSRLNNIYQLVYDDGAPAAPKALFARTAMELLYAPITAHGILAPVHVQGYNPQPAASGLIMTGGMAARRLGPAHLSLAITNNLSYNVVQSPVDPTIDILDISFAGATAQANSVQGVATATGAQGNTGRVRGLVFSPGGGQLYFSQPFAPQVGYVRMNDLTVHDVQAELGTASLAAYGYGQIRGNKDMGGTGAAIYFPYSGGFGYLSGPDNPATATWHGSASGVAAPPASLMATVTSPSWPLTQYLMDMQNYNDQQIPSLLQQACCLANERIPEANHTNTFAGTTTQATPWTPQNNPLASALLCALPGSQAGHVFFAQDFTVQTGAKLYVSNMEWRFAPTARLIIQKGAFVQFDNCILRGDVCAPGKWPGVELYGTPTAIQGHSAFPADQGRLVLNNSTVQDAVVGVTVGKKDIFGIVVGTGGILEATGSTFRNCRIGVNFYAYQNKLSNGSPTGNRSTFVRTTFTADAAYISPLDFALHAQLWKVDGIRFMGCTFNNLRTTEHNSSQLGRGIHSLDANFQVLSLCGDPGPTPPGMCQNVIPTRFAGLDMGIRAANAVTARNFTVDHAEFSNNVCGVYANSVLNFEVHNSNFQVGSNKATALDNVDEQYWDVNGAKAHRGIYSYQSWGFLVDDNTFTNNTNASSSRLEGIVTGYSGGHNDVVFRNHASHLYSGYVGEGICADQVNTSYLGLWYLCNTNSDNQNGIWDRRENAPNHASFTQQTIRLYQGSPSRPADNTFGQVSGQIDVGNTNFSLGNTNNPLTYWWALPAVPYWPKNTTAGVSSYNQDVNGNYIVRDPANCVSRTLLPTPEPPGPVASRNALGNYASAEKTAYGNIRYLYDQLIDGGSTDETVQEIQSTWPNEAWELRQSLLSKSPYLSTDVLMAMVEKNIMPPAMVAEICIANPEATKRDGFMDWLQYKAPVAMPQYLLDNIMASWEVKTYRTTLEANMAYHHSEMTQALDLVIASYHADTLVEQVDSIRATWQVLRTPAARYAEILTYLQQDNFDSAYAVMDRLPVEFKLKDKEVSEKDRTKQYIGIVQGYRTNGRSEAELQDNELIALKNLRDGGYDLPGEWAQNILCFGYGDCRPPRTGGDDVGAPKAMRLANTTTEAFPPVLSVYPNPAGAWANLSYNLKAVASEGYIAIRDIAGKEVARIPVERTEGQAVWDTRAVAPGTYTVDLVNGGVSVGATKLVVKQ